MTVIYFPHIYSIKFIDEYGEVLFFNKHLEKFEESVYTLTLPYIELIRYME